MAVLAAVGKTVASAGRSTPGDDAQHHLGRNHGGAGVAGGDKTAGAALLAPGASPTRIDESRFMLDGLGGLLVHADELGGMDDSRWAEPAASGC